MNCANHPDRERAAFCQHCGKPLCTECVRNLGTSVYCEPCLTARTSATPPQAGYTAGPSGYQPFARPAGSSEPSPGLAALLGLIPGVGAMYNEQYAKGIVHLVVFAVLVSLAHDVDIFGLFVFGWICYMSVEAYHTARARRDGTPLPNPFGLNDLSERLGFGRAWPGNGPGAAPFGNTEAPSSAGPAQNPGAGTPNAPPADPYASPYGYSYVPPVSQWGAPNNAWAVPPIPPVPPVPPMNTYPDPNLPYSRRFPSGAIWLIGLGVFFMIGNIPVFHMLHGRLLGPVLLIGFGVWLFVRKMINTGPGLENDGSAFYHWRLMRAITGSAWMVIVGLIWLLDALHILSWANSWPLFIIATGLMMFFRHTMSGYGYGYPPPVAAQPPAAPVTTTDIVPSNPQSQPGNGNQEGR
jgi:TM2 domain-containing membrane protein YozV